MNFSSNNGNSVLFCAFVFGLGTLANRSSGMKCIRTNGSQSPFESIGFKFLPFITSIYINTRQSSYNKFRLTNTVNIKILDIFLIYYL